MSRQDMAGGRKNWSLVGKGTQNYIFRQGVNTLSTDVCLLGYDNIWRRYKYLNIWNLREQKNLNIEKIVFKVVQIKSLAMHITNQKLSYIMVGNLQ